MKAPARVAPGPFADAAGPSGDPAAWLSAIVNSAEDAILGKSLAGDVVSWNPAAERLFGYAAAEIVGRPAALLANPAFPHETDELTARALRGERITAHETTRRRKDGSIVPVSLTLSLVRNDSGTVVGSSKIVRDITERRQHDAYIGLLTADLEHRTNNLLALAIGYLRLTHRDTVTEFREALIGRIEALGSANSALGAGNWRHAKLKLLVRKALHPFAMRTDATVLRGPDVAITAAAAQTWAITLYELATNSLKYGALGHHGGTVEVAWGLEDDGLWFTWRERGGPPAAPPTRSGLGLRLIRGAIEHQLQGRLRLDWAPEGFTCRIDLPGTHIAPEE